MHFGATIRAKRCPRWKRKATRTTLHNNPSCLDVPGRPSCPPFEKKFQSKIEHCRLEPFHLASTGKHSILRYVLIAKCLHSLHKLCQSYICTSRVSLLNLHRLTL